MLIHRLITGYHWSVFCASRVTWFSSLSSLIPPSVSLSPPSLRPSLPPHPSQFALQTHLVVCHRIPSCTSLLDNLSPLSLFIPYLIPHLFPSHFPSISLLQSTISAYFSHMFRVSYIRTNRISPFIDWISFLPYTNQVIARLMGNCLSSSSPPSTKTHSATLLDRLFAKTRLDHNALVQTCPPPVSYSSHINFLIWFWSPPLQNTIGFVWEGA